ncbi:MAG: Zn-dependent hydrolase, partial [Vicinamibacteria bacterium]
MRLALSLTFLLCGGASAAQTLQINAARLERLLRELSEFGKNPEGGVTRLAFSEEDRAARAWVMDKFQEAGFEAWVDAAANIHARLPGTDPSLPVILFGSHIDSVPKGGNFDGGVGSMGALEVMMTLRDGQVATRHPVEMIIWSDEEGVHYGKPYIGSRAATRGLEPGDLDLVDENGASMADWLRRYGLDPDQIETVRMDPTNIAAYLELHIEQGAVLVSRGIQIGVVEGIVGIDEFRVVVEGFANHAGTTPMEERRDALVAAARLIQTVRAQVMVRPGRQVGNVGWIQVVPGAPNVVPGLVHTNIELRDLRREVIDDMIARIREAAKAIADEEGVSISIERYASDEPALTDPALQEVIEQVAQGAGFSTLRMPSGAGHDAQSLGRV